MPAHQVHLDLADCAELAEMLTFISQWLGGTDHAQLAASSAPRAMTSPSCAPTWPASPSCSATTTASNSSAPARTDPPTAGPATPPRPARGATRDRGRYSPRK
jgi:hypothetical protein